jgi:hypothetical protein
MKSSRIYFIFTISCGLLLTSCNKKQSSEEQKIEDVSQKADELSTKAVTDSTFTSSDEYKSEMDRFNAALIKKTIAMDENERLLVFFESSLRMLKQYSDKVKQNPALVRNKNYMKIAQEWGYKVQEYNQALKKVNLTPNQKGKFNYLNTNFSKL